MDGLVWFIDNEWDKSRTNQHVLSQLVRTDQLFHWRLANQANVKANRINWNSDARDWAAPKKKRLERCHSFFRWTRLYAFLVRVTTRNKIRLNCFVNETCGMAGLTDDWQEEGTRRWMIEPASGTLFHLALFMSRFVPLTPFASTPKTRCKRGLCR